MADPTHNEDVLDDASKLAAAARDRGMEQLEGAKGQLAEGAERMAAAVERTADELEGDGDDTISGYGRSLANLMRQLAGGLRERDIEQFAGELGSLARRNPGMFLAGSVALGFGVARFFKARTAQRSPGYDYGPRQGDYDGAQQSYRMQADRAEFDADESLDLSRNPEAVERRDEASPSVTDSVASTEVSAEAGAQAARDDRGQSKSRSAGKKAKQQRSATEAGAKESTDLGGKQS